MKDTQRPYQMVIPIKLPIERLADWGVAYAKLAKKTGAELFVIWFILQAPAA